MRISDWSSDVCSSDLWHLTCAGQTSWHGFAEAIMAGAVERGLLDKAPKVFPIATSAYPTPAARPAFSVLDNTRPQCDFDLPGVAGRDSLGQVAATLADAAGACPAADWFMTRSAKGVGGAASLNAEGGRVG